MSLTEDELLIANELQREYPHLDRLMATTIVWHSLRGKKIDADLSKQDADESSKIGVHRQQPSHTEQQDIDRISTAAISA